MYLIQFEAKKLGLRIKYLWGCNIIVYNFLQIIFFHILKERNELSGKSRRILFVIPYINFI